MRLTAGYWRAGLTSYGKIPFTPHEKISELALSRWTRRRVWLSGPCQVAQKSDPSPRSERGSERLLLPDELGKAILSAADGGSAAGFPCAALRSQAGPMRLEWRPPLRPSPADR